ncbi:DUF6134 family protein [Elongatibacter sediminis]|uniref:DUF6134 family protein n=1 Tax=Elongatibacter sediminis TaxID=3119006 RepID=A0AAW9RAF1_9GAMM
MAERNLNEAVRRLGRISYTVCLAWVIVPTALAAVSGRASPGPALLSTRASGRDDVIRAVMRLYPPSGVFGLVLALLTGIAVMVLPAAARAQQSPPGDQRSAGAPAPDPVTENLATLAEQAERHWKFRVFVDDKEVGFHHFYLDVVGDRHVLRSVADFEYKVLFLTLYRYGHENREVWDGHCLTRIESATDANGKPFAVDGRRLEDRFVVQGSKGEHDLPECVMSFAYWNPEFLSASRLLNTQTGEYLEVDISEPQPDRLDVGGRETEAWRYRLQAEKLELDLWYSDNDEWLGLRTRYENGRTLRYQLESGPQSPAGIMTAL